MTDKTSTSLLELARAGDQSAFAALVNPHRASLWGVCLRITRDHHLAEDALQDALLAAWRNLHRFGERAAFSTWLYRIAANAALTLVRKRREATLETMPEVPMADPTDAFVDSDRITQALRMVPPDFREALVLREYGDFSYEEIAIHQGVGVQTVKSRLSRARAAVRAALEEG